MYSDRGLSAAAAEAGVPLASVEDGFLRSVGLGSAFLPPASIVVDATGIYYDPRRPSDLERILATHPFEAALLERARALRERLVELGLSKYNVGAHAELDIPRDRPVVLVVGQVDDDRSVVVGAPDVGGNLGLLKAARARNPDAFLIYKPHPDVVAGYRIGHIPQHVTDVLADLVISDVSIVELFPLVDRVETMSSLAGFEALLRGIPVTCHGRPFYAGWGLTEDLVACERRGRRLELDALVAGTLILYPRYLDPVSMRPCPPEFVVERLAEAMAAERAAGISGRKRIRNTVVRLRHQLLGPIGRALR
jgi:capsular polysaccharide export protein